MSSKTKGLLILLFAYIAAFAAGFGVYQILDGSINIYLNLFIADAVATAVTWLFGVIVKSASVYDPYWSVQTPAIMLSLMIGMQHFSLGAILFLVFVLFWAVRLTGNFIRGFHDISYIDWRYRMLREKTGPFFQLVNLCGICMFPTVVVYLASLPALAYIINGSDFSAWNLIGLSVMCCGTMLELISDRQMKSFIKNRKDRSEIIRTGLWKYSRHPNYLGEILFWYGVALVFILPDLSNYMYLGGALLNHLMFLFISVPMAEKNMAKYKSDFAQYKKEVRMFLPIRRTCKS